MLEFLLSPTGLLLVTLGFGLLVGSFLNVVILRLPKRLEWDMLNEAKEMVAANPGELGPRPPTLTVDRSRCPKCGTLIPGWHNIPVLSYAILGGKCAACKTHISWQYPIVEAVTGLLFAAVAWKFGLGWPMLGALVFTGFLVALSVIDGKTSWLPDALTLPLMWIGLLIAAIQPMFCSLEQAVLGAAGGYLMLFLVDQLGRLILGKQGMAAGDFKLLAAIGAFVGLEKLAVVILMAAIAGIVIGGSLALLRPKSRANTSLVLESHTELDPNAASEQGVYIPFGPYLAIAGWLTLMFGDVLLKTYTASFSVL
jgi:leader peptidase (prepilin peptidase) / N-methyltransferase